VSCLPLVGPEVSGKAWDRIIVLDKDRPSHGRRGGVTRKVRARRNAAYGEGQAARLPGGARSMREVAEKNLYPHISRATGGLEGTGMWRAEACTRMPARTPKSMRPFSGLRLRPSRNTCSAGVQVQGEHLAKRPQRLVPIEAVQEHEALVEELLGRGAARGDGVGPDPQPPVERHRFLLRWRPGMLVLREGRQTAGCEQKDKPTQSHLSLP